MLSIAAATVCLLLSVLQPLVQAHPTWYHHNGQYGVPEYSPRRKVHYLQEGRPVHTGNVEYRLHRGYPQWNYDTAEEPAVNIPLLNSINQRLSAYMHTSSHLRNRLAAMGWHGAKSIYDHRHPHRPNVPFMGHDHIRPASAINPHQEISQKGVFDSGLDGGSKKILGSLPHYMILEATPENKKPGAVPKYDSFGDREIHRPLLTTAVPISTESYHKEEATSSIASSSFEWKLESSESPKFATETTTSRASLLEGNQNPTSPSTQLEEKSTATLPSSVPGKDSGPSGQEVKNYTVVRDKNLITATPTVKEKSTTEEEIVHTIPVDFAEGTEKSILENNSATENPHIPIISLSGDDLKLIEDLKPGVHEEDEDKSGFVSKGESIYVEFPEAAYGKDKDGQNVKEGDNERDSTVSGILKLLKGIFMNGSQDVITPTKDLTYNKPGSTVEDRTEVSTLYYDSFNEERDGNSSQGIVLTDGVKLSTDTSSVHEPTTVTFRSHTDYNIEYNTEPTTMLYYEEVSGRQLADEDATDYISTLSNTEPTRTFPSELAVSTEFGAPTATLESTETVTIGRVGYDKRTEPSAVITLEDVTVTAENHGRVWQEGETVTSGITVPENVAVTTESYSPERSPQLHEGPFTEDAIVTTERHIQGDQDETTIEDVRITTELHEYLGKEGETELIGVTITEGVPVSTERHEEMGKEGTTVSITDNTKHADQVTQEGRTLDEDVEVETEAYIFADRSKGKSTTPQQSKEGNVNVEFDVDLSTTINYANGFTANVATEYTTEFTSHGKSVEHTTQVMEIEDNDGEIIIKLSNNEGAHGDGTISTTAEYFTSTKTHATNDPVTEVTESHGGEVTIDMDVGQDQNVTPNEKHSTDLPQTVVTNPSPYGQDVGLIRITGDVTDSTILLTHDTLDEEEATTHFTDDNDLTTAIYPTMHPRLDGVYDVQPTSTPAITEYLSTDGESSAERESKELISSNEVTGKEDGLTDEKITFQEESKDDDGTNNHEYGGSFHENNMVKGNDLYSSHKSEIPTSDIHVPVTEEKDLLSDVNQTPQPVEDEVTKEGWTLDISVPEITTQNAYSDEDTTEEMRTVSSVESSQDLSVENPRKENANSADDIAENVSEWQDVSVEESLEFSTVYAETRETLTTESTTQIEDEENSSDIEEETNMPQTARNIVEEISTNEPFEFTTVYSTAETPDFPTQASPLRGLSDDESLPYTTAEHTSKVQQIVGLTTEGAPTNIFGNQELKTQIRVNEEISTTEHLPRNDEIVREPSSTESVLSTQMTTIAAETTERDVQSTTQTVDDELSNRDDFDLTTYAILEEATTSDEGMKLITQDSGEPLTAGEKTDITNLPVDNVISVVEQNRQSTGKCPSAETSTVQQGPNITPSSTTIGKDTSFAKEDMEIKTHTSEEDTSTVESDLKSTTNTGIENIDTSTETYVSTSTVGIEEDSTTVLGDADLTTQEFETTMQNTAQEEDESSHTVTTEITTKKLTEEENTICPDIKVSTRTNITTIILEQETVPQNISGEDCLTTETVPELRTQLNIEEATPTIQEDFTTTTKTPDDGEETSTVEEEPETEALTTTFPPDEETSSEEISTPGIETTTELIETVTAAYEAHTILDLNPPVETAEASTTSSVQSSSADTLRRSDIEIDNNNHHGNFYPYQDLLQVMLHGMSSSTEKITSFTTETNANADDIDVRISARQHLTTNYEDERSGRTLTSNYKGRKDKLFQEEKMILESSTVGKDDSTYYRTETYSTAIYNPDSEHPMAVAEVQPYDDLSKISQKDTDLVFEDPSTKSPTLTGETSTAERLKLNHISTAHLNTLDHPQPSDEEPNPDDHQPTFSVWELLELIPVIIEEVRNGHITEEEYDVFGEIFGDLWPVLVAEAKGNAERGANGQPGIGEMLSKIMEDQEIQELMAERHRRNRHTFENNYNPLLTALVSNRDSKTQSWRPLPGGSGITRIFYPRRTGRTTPRKRNFQPSDLETQETRNIIRRLKNIKLDTWLMLWDILSGSEYFRGERDIDGSGHWETETTYDTSVPRRKYHPLPNSEDDTEVGDEYEEPYYDDDYSDDDAKIADLLAILPDPPKPREA